MTRTTVLLDAGGVLLDEAELEQCVCNVVTGLVQRREPEYGSDDYWADTREAILRFAPSTPLYVLWKRVRHDAQAYSLLLTDYRTTLAARRPALKLYEEMITELPQLADGFRLVLAGQYGRGVYDLLERHGLAGLFANRLSQEDFGITKPDPRYVALIAERSGARPEQCIVVGDRIDKDVIPGKQNGMGTVFVKTGIYRIQEPRTLDEVPDITLEGLSGLARQVKTRWGG